MKRYPWPGNVRELRNIVERAKILCEGDEVMPEHLGLPTLELGNDLASEPGTASPAGGGASAGTLAETEWAMIQDALSRHNGNKTAAARALGISLRTLYNKLEAKAKEGVDPGTDDA